MKKILQIVEWFSQKLNRDAIDAWAGQTALFMIISVFPALLLFFSLCRFIHVGELDLIEHFFAIVSLPAAIEELLLSVVQEATDHGEIAFISVSAITALWGISRSTYSLARGLRVVYKTKEARFPWVVRLFSFLYTAAFFVLIGVTLVLLVFWNTIMDFLIPLFPAFEGPAVFILSFRFLVVLVVLTAAFVFLYKVLPNNPMRLGQLLPGAVLAAAGWMIFSQLYSFYIDHFSNYTSLYGSLTAIVLMILWLYFCMYILLFGAEVNVWLQERK